jgi:hypothetical protein
VAVSETSRRSAPRCRDHPCAGLAATVIFEARPRWSRQALRPPVPHCVLSAPRRKCDRSWRLQTFAGQSTTGLRAGSTTSARVSIRGLEDDTRGDATGFDVGDRDPVQHGLEDRQRDLVVGGKRHEHELAAAPQRPVRLLERPRRDRQRNRLIGAPQGLDELDRILLGRADRVLGAELPSELELLIEQIDRDNAAARDRGVP